mmetsp:Transcript_32551/g.75848  ORF Transcript_32551/g.75848 Transcript_32551/m.75848 type:complete len:429 (+) Transcript_32551:615-1901(+)
MSSARQGTIAFNLSSVEGDEVPVCLQALYCPNARNELLSVTAMLDVGWDFQFRGIGSAALIAPSGDIIPLFRHGSLFRVIIKPAPKAQHLVLACTASLSQAQLWHLRCGHVNIDALARSDARGLPKLTAADAPPCQDCLKGKARRTGPGHLGVINSHVTVPLALVFLDISWPMHTPAMHPDGKTRVKYSLIVVDKFTGCKWDLPLRAKTDTIDVTKQWLIDVHGQQTYYKVRRFHMDNGTEFTSSAFKTLCTENSIAQTFSASYEPRANGYVERAIGTLTRLACTMLKTSRAPLHTWWLVRNYAAEITNAFRLRAGVDYSPHELFTQQQPDASLFMPFGAYCYCWIDRRLASDPKWALSGFECIFVGIGACVSKRLFAVLTKEGKLLFPLLIRVDMTFFPYRITSSSWRSTVRCSTRLSRPAPTLPRP